MENVGAFMILIDSNMWCFYLNENSKEHDRVLKPVEEALATRQILSNTIIIMEVSHFLVKNLGPRIGKEKIDTMLSFPLSIFDIDFSLMKKSIALLCDYSHTGIGGRDATLLATLKAAEANKIMTNDGAFKKIDWVDVIDPLEKLNKKEKNRNGKQKNPLGKDWDNKYDERWNKWNKY